jgi:hypothetical protein
MDRYEVVSNEGSRACFHRKMHSERDELDLDAIGWLANAVGLVHGPEDRCPAVDKLGDAILVAEEETIDRLTPAAVDALWNAELEALIREGLNDTAARGGWEGNEPEVALTALDALGKESSIARAVVQQVAQSVAHEGLNPFFCLDCLEQAIVHAKPAERRQRACEAAAVGARDLAIEDSELRTAMRTHSGSAFARALATDKRREATRARLRSIARLGTNQIPALAGELRLLLDEPMPEDAADDPLWTALCASLVQLLEPSLN